MNFKSFKKKLFKEFIISESVKSIDDALEVFGLSSVPNSESELRKLYKQLAIKNHPDRNGGSDEKMKDVNLSFEILRKNLGYTSSSMSRTSSSNSSMSRTSSSNKSGYSSNSNDFVRNNMEILRPIIIQVEEYIDKKLDDCMIEFERYFNTISNGNQSFSAYYEKTVKGKVGNSWKNVTVEQMTKGGFQTLLYDIHIKNKDNSISFDSRIYIDFSNLYGKVILGNPEDLEVSIDTVGFFDNRKQDLFKKHYSNSSNLESVLSQPDILFNEKKIKKILSGGARTKSKSKFSKRDALTFISKFLYSEDVGYENTYGIILYDTGINPEMENNRYVCSFKKHNNGTIALELRRYVIDRYPMWTMSRIFIIDSNAKGRMRTENLDIKQVIHFPENEKYFEYIKEFADRTQKMKDEKQVLREIDNFSLFMKNEVSKDSSY